MELTLTSIVIGIGVTVGSVMLGIIGFFLIRLVNSIDRMGKDIGEIKVSLKEVAVRHDNLESELETQRERINIIYKKIFA